MPAKKQDVETIEDAQAMEGAEAPKPAEDTKVSESMVPAEKAGTITEKPAEEKQAVTKDLTKAVSGLWPGNTPHRVGSYYCSLQKLELKGGEAGILCAMPEGFVFERVDVHGLEAATEDVQIELELQKDPLLERASMGIFHMDKGTTSVRQIAENTVYPGLHVSKKQVYLRSGYDIPDKGRLLISFIGYQIEPWR